MKMYSGGGHGLEVAATVLKGTDGLLGITGEAFKWSTCASDSGKQFVCPVHFKPRRTQ